MSPAAPALTRIRRVVRIAGVEARHVLTLVGLSVASALLGALGFGLVVPLASGLANHSFDFVARLPLLGRVIAPATPMATAFSLLVATIVITSLASIVLKYVAARYNHRRNTERDEAIKAHVLTRVLSLSRRFFDERNQGGVTRVVDLSGSLVGIFGSAQEVLAAACQLAARLALIVYISWRMAIGVAILLYLLDRVIGRLRAHLKKLAREGSALRKDLAHQIFNIFASIDLVKSCANEAAVLARYHAKRAELRALDERADMVRGLGPPIQDTARLVTLALLVVVLMATVGLDDTRRMAELLVMFWVGQSALPYYNEISDARMSIIRNLPDVDELLDVLENTDAYVMPSGSRRFTGLADAIELRGLSFAYGEATPKPALDGLSLVLPRGRVTALAGKTGSGKSTVAKLLVRLYDCPPGAIFVDGVDIRELSLASLQAEIAYVSQNDLIFDDSVRANLTFGAPGRSDDEIWDALRRVDLAETIAARPEGLDTRLGDHGVKLSGGERQRVAIARALLRRASILVLDEATSALDAITERRIMDELAAARPGQTVLVIAHRLTTIRDAGSIAYLDAGQVVEQGTWQELIARGGRFQAAWTAMGGEREAGALESGKE